MKIKYMLVLGVLVSLFVHSEIVISQNDADIITYYIPQFETLDLVQDGSLATPYILNLTNTFDFIFEFTFILHFSSNMVDIENFADDSPLTNGLNVYYHGQTILNNINITSNDDIQQYSDVFDEYSDDLNPKSHQYTGTWVFTHPYELVINDEYQLQFYIQDNITSLTSVSEFFVRVQGYNVQNVVINNPQQDRIDPLNWFFSNFWGPNGPNIINLGILVIPVIIVIVFFKRKM